jgi:hypothetical protein
VVLRKREYAVDHQDHVESYDQFCIFDHHAHLAACAVQIAAVFDRRKHIISFPPLIRELDSTGLVAARVLAEAKAKLARANVITAKVEVLRHGLFADRSASLPYKDAFKEANLTANELRDLMDISLSMANRLLTARGLK